VLSKKVLLQSPDFSKNEPTNEAAGSSKNHEENTDLDHKINHHNDVDIDNDSDVNTNELESSKSLVSPVSNFERIGFYLGMDNLCKEQNTVLKASNENYIGWENKFF